MAWIDDLDLLNNAANSGNWTANGFDSPTLNDSSATTPIYVEGSACMWWPLKKGTTNGYTYTSTISGTPTLTNRICVGFLNYAFADIDAIPISSLSMRLSSSTGFTSNYIQWDARAQVLSPENTPISGHTPVIGYEDAGTESGTFNGNAEAVGWVATTGNDADGKQGGFDFFYLISWLGAHSATYTETYFSGLYSEYFDNEGSGLPGQTNRPLGVLSKAGNNYTTNVSFQLGDGTSDTANVVVTESGKAIFFNNLHVNHELGYIFVNPASTNEAHIILNGVNHSWNDQAATNEIYKNMANADIVRIDGGSDTNGGRVTCRSHISDANTYIKNRVFAACRSVTPGDMLVEDCTVSDAQSPGMVYEAVGDGSRVKRTTYANCTTAAALEIETVGNYTLDGDTFSGNTFDILNSGNAATITAGSFVVGRAYKILTVGSTDYTLIGSANNTIGTKFVATGVGAGTGTATEVLLINATNGANPSAVSNTGTNADTLIQNAVSVTVTVLDDSTGLALNLAHVYLIDSVASTVILSGATNASGIITTSINYSADIAAVGWARQMDLVGTDYVPKDISGTITTNGLSLTVRLEPL